MNIKIYESDLLKALDKQTIRRVNAILHKMCDPWNDSKAWKNPYSYLFPQHSYVIERARCIFPLENNKTGVQWSQVTYLRLPPKSVL